MEKETEVKSWDLRVESMMTKRDRKLGLGCAANELVGAIYARSIIAPVLSTHLSSCDFDGTRVNRRRTMKRTYAE